MAESSRAVAACTVTSAARLAPTMPLTSFTTPLADATMATDQG